MSDMVIFPAFLSLMNNNLSKCIASVIMKKGYTIETLSGKLRLTHSELTGMLECPYYHILKEIADILGIGLWKLLEIRRANHSFDKDDCLCNRIFNSYNIVAI